MSKIELKDALISIKQEGKEIGIGIRQSADKKLSLKADSGKITLIKSPNHEAATAVLLATMGLWPLQSGYATLDGEVILPTTRALFASTYAYVPRDLNLGTHTLSSILETVYANLYDDVPKNGLKEVYNELQKLQLDKRLMKEPLCNIAPSVRRLAMIAAILSTNRSIVLLDSPTLEMETEQKNLLINRLKQLATEGKTIIIASTDVAIENQSDTIIELNEN